MTATLYLAGLAIAAIAGWQAATTLHGNREEVRDRPPPPQSAAATPPCRRCGGRSWTANIDGRITRCSCYISGPEAAT